ncbi:MAG: fibronectin type III domain-containing protein [Candidatus Nealsonbacteria bacterium]
MTSNTENIEKKLKMVQPKPLTQAEKNVLWLKIEKGIKEDVRQHSYFPQPLIFFGLRPRFVFASLLIVVLLGGSVATMAASDNAKPGDILYPIDIMLEKVQLVFSTNRKKDSLYIQFAEERLSEAKIILAFVESDDFDISDEATTTPPIKERKSQKFNLKRIKRAGNALTIALENLEQTKIIFEEKGNMVAMLAIDKIIEELTGLAENHVSDLDNFETEIEYNDEKKLEIKTSRDKLKIKFNLGQEKKYQRRGEEIEMETELENDDENENSNQQGEQGREKVTICHIPPGNPDKAHTIIVARAAVETHLNRGDIPGPCEEDTATSTSDTIAPLISEIASNASTTMAEISWDTNEPSDSKVWYSTTTPLVISETTPFVTSTDLVTNHTVSLSNLTASTTYYFIVSSTDAAGNFVTSIQSSFTTLPEEQEPEDTTPPTLTNIMATSTIATSTFISWKTDEKATSKVWYGSSTQLTISTSTPMVENSDLVFNHSLQITGLTASSTYYYIVSSSDESGNTATSSEFSFTTL